MGNLQTAASAADRLHALVLDLQEHVGFSDVVNRLLGGHDAALDGVWGSSRALLTAALVQHAPGLVLVVCPHSSELDDLYSDLELFTQLDAERFPAWESDRSEQVLHDEIYGSRLRVLKHLVSRQAPKLLVTSIQSLLQAVPNRERLVSGTRRLQVGQEVARQNLMTWLTQQGFHHTTAVELPGECSVRGGIIDIFAPDWSDPVRVEFFGDEVESLRSFDVSSQRSITSLESVDITLIDADKLDREHLAAYLPSETWLLLIEPAELDEEGRNYLRRLDHPEDYHSTRETFRRLASFPSATVENVASGSHETLCHLQIESSERFSGDIGKVREELDTVGDGREVFVVCETEAEAKRLGEIFVASRLAADGRLQFPTGRLTAGFSLIPEQVVLVSGAELFQRADLGRSARRHKGRVIDSFLALREGDLVVHLAHGIGRYRGLTLLDKDGQVEEFLELEFHGGTKIYVPSSKIDLVQKYVGGRKSAPSLARIGGKSWVRQKEAAEQAVTDLAAEMLELQAARAARTGIRFPEDTAWQLEFDASFPYHETPDQMSAIEAIKQDMSEPRPMDRLLCGDVGFGKTELAIRAAFKAVDAGYQVAVLVPTTILAEQHRRTFGSRMAEFPVEIATLSRFCTKKEQDQVIEGLKGGTVDIVIGTHRLAQRDVQFHNLGLVVIDEEQRFGVAVKERLKSLRQIVDVLTMTATPIPRTLHMSLLGIRNISNLETPPEDRLSIETRVTRWSDELIRHAVMRELNRGGQIFFVHNRVRDIQTVLARLKRIVPEARIDIAHGQMPEGKLEDVMIRFLDHRFDLLLATTIVESGLDIPNTNTIFIDDADRYGLADMHQLRGRVGRYKHRAYCYLLIDEAKHLTQEAARRLRAIEEFSDMGAGFSIAMRDLELRGAGNILGTQQSGHIATVGYELYCAMLDKAVRQLKRLPPKESVEVNVDLPGEAYLPRQYVPDMRARIDLYRRLARLDSESALDDYAKELVDRFGAHLDPVDRLIRHARLRLWAHSWKVASVHIEEPYAVLGYTSSTAVQLLAEKSGGRLRLVDSRSAYLPLDKELTIGTARLDAIESLLRPLP